MPQQQVVFQQPFQESNQFQVVQAINVFEDGQFQLVTCKKDAKKWCQQSLLDENIEEELKMDREGLVFVNRGNVNVKASKPIIFAFAEQYGCPEPKSKDPRVKEFCEHYGDQILKDGVNLNGQLGAGIIGGNNGGVVNPALRPGGVFQPQVNPNNPLQPVGGQQAAVRPQPVGPLQPAGQNHVGGQQPPAAAQPNRPQDNTPPLANTPFGKWTTEFFDDAKTIQPPAEKMREAIAGNGGKVDPKVGVFDTECVNTREPANKVPFKMFLVDKTVAGGQPQVSIALRKSDTMPTLDAALMNAAGNASVTLSADAGSKSQYASVGGTGWDEFGGQMPQKEYYLKRLSGMTDARGNPAYSLLFVVKHPPSQAKAIGKNDDVYSCRSTGTTAPAAAGRPDQMALVTPRLDGGMLSAQDILNAE